MDVKRTWARWMWAAGAVLLLIGGGLWFGTRVQPRWFHQRQQVGQGASDAAWRFEQDVVSEMQKIRDENPWALRIDEAMLNNWFATRLQAWVQNQGGMEAVESLGEVRARCRSGAVDLGIEHGGRVASITIGVSGPTGAQAVTIDGLSLGLLPLDPRSGEWLLGHIAGEETIRSWKDDSVIGEALRQLLSEGLPVREVPLSDGRTVLIEDVQVRQGAIFVKFVTSRRSNQPDLPR